MNLVLNNGKDTKKIKITVRPESNLYSEPDLTFGMSRAAVKSKLGTPDAEKDNTIAYFWDNTAKAPILMCTFKSDKLSSYSFFVKTAYSSELSTFLAERYIPYAYSGYTFAFVNGLDESTITMCVGAILYDRTFWMAIYLPYPLESRNNSNVDYPEILRSIDEIMDCN